MQLKHWYPVLLGIVCTCTTLSVSLKVNTWESGVGGGGLTLHQYGKNDMDQTDIGLQSMYIVPLMLHAIYPIILSAFTNMRFFTTGKMYPLWYCNWYQIYLQCPLSTILIAQLLTFIDLLKMNSQNICMFWHWWHHFWSRSFIAKDV